MRWVRSTCVVVGVLACGNGSDGLDGDHVLAEAIRYHDPDGQWGTFANTLVFEESRPNGQAYETFVTLDNTTGSFEYERDDGENHVVKRVAADACSGSLNGSSTFTADEEETHRLSCDQIKRSRNYYLYLWGLPMKLRDSGTLVAERATMARFDDRDVMSLRVTYEEDVGSDVWYFYFDPESYRMVGYRFYHDESANDGEFITLEGEYRLGNIRIPQRRSWYRNADSGFLGTDVLRAHSSLSLTSEG